MLGYAGGARPGDGFRQCSGSRIGTSLSGDNWCRAVGRSTSAGRKPNVLVRKPRQDIQVFGQDWVAQIAELGLAPLRGTNLVIVLSNDRRQSMTFLFFVGSQIRAKF